MPIAGIALKVSSTAFSDGQTIPRQYTCEGQDISPPLEWSSTPRGAKSFAIVCDDPDAPSSTFTHWVLYDLTPETTELAEGSSGGGTEGMNSFGKAGYGGPCPPPGHGPHRYMFKVYALDIESVGRAGLSKSDLTAAMTGHVLAEGQLMGRYERIRK